MDRGLKAVDLLKLGCYSLLSNTIFHAFNPPQAAIRLISKSKVRAYHLK
jgi:hypothetical protein